MELKPISFDTETNIIFKLELETTGKNRFWYTLIAKFSGTYRSGSAGAPDAHFIVGIAQTAVSMWHPGALVLDLRKLCYVWGDEMDGVLSSHSYYGIPFAVVGSDECLPAIGTLFNGVDSKIPATDTDYIFDNLEEAWEYVRKKD